MLAVGDKLPDESAPNQNDELVYLKNFLGQKLCVFFYPKAMTKGCTIEVNNINDHFEEFNKLKMAVLGVSADTVEEQKEFHDTYHLQYDLLADVDKKIINAFGVWGKKNMYGKEYEGILRAAFLFDENGICTKVLKRVNTKTASTQILKK